MTPTTRNRLLELFMSGAKQAASGAQPEQTGYMLPLARYEGGGIAPAVPGALTDLYNAMMSGMTADPSGFNAASPEQRQAYDQQNIGNAMIVGGAAGVGSMPFARPANSLGSFGGRIKKDYGATDRVVSVDDGMGGVGGSRSPDGSTFEIGTSWLDEGMRGQGIGVNLYKTIVDDALKDGMRIQSDSQVSADAVRMYEALERRGYSVKRADDIVSSPGGTLQSSSRKPVFTITGKDN